MPHYVTLSPLEHPVIYAFFGLTWLSCLFCIWVSFYFYRARKGTWWLLIAATFVFPVLAELSMCLLHGLPPLPYTLVYPEQNLHPPPLGPEEYQEPGPHAWTTTTMTMSVSRAQWSFYPPMMALALGWAYLADRKKRTVPTAQT